jgi:dipeptidase E
MKTTPRILLISNSTVHGRGYLDHVEKQIRSFLGTAKTVLFFPFALFNRDEYAAKAKARLAEMGYRVDSAHIAKNRGEAIGKSDAIFIGGGNTFRLLKSLQDLKWIEPVRNTVNAGVPYIGSSAGSNVAGPQSRRPRICRPSNHSRSSR